MTYKHECRNCRWSVLKFDNRFVCSNVKSGRNNVDISDWCGKWEAEHDRYKEERSV